MSTSQQLFERAQAHIPGGVNSPVRAFRAVGGTPVFVERSEGPYIFDCQGKRYLARVQAFVRKSGLEHLVHFAPVSFDDLPSVYQRASVFLYPSFYEGFGIPILEALFSRTPVVTSSVSSLPEAAGPGAYLANPGDPAEIAAGIEKILSDESYRNELAEKGHAHAQQFRGEPLSHKMMDLYKKVVGSGHTAPEPIT